MACRNFGRIGLSLAFAFVAGLSAGMAGEDDPATAPPAENRRILFLGNSITRHGPKPDIDWHGDWGMAATSAERDYVHLVVAAITGRTGKPPEILVRNIADFERAYDAYDVEAKLKDAFAFDADLVVLAIGENVPAFKSDAEADRFEAGVARILAGVRAHRRPLIIVRSGFWPEQTRDARLRKVSDAAGARFVDISALGRDPSNAARSERPYKHSGVGNHPGDRGMKAIADAIVGEIYR